MATEEIVIQEVSNHLCYETAKAVTTHPYIIAWVVISVLVPLFLYIIAGLTIRARSGSGQVSSKPMAASINYYWAFIIWGIIQAVLLLLLIFPVWLKPFC